MKVIATQMGFLDGNRIRPGAVFEVPEGSKAKWYTPVDGAASKAKDKQPKDKQPNGAKPEALSEMGKEPPKTFNEVNGKADLA